ncbi:MAG TPA: hypothetical protein DEP84_23165 [Chloroflexi bacterium]|nr:hypothetical protein [Chloroflexota bacterium]
MLKAAETGFAGRISQLERSLGAHRQVHVWELDELERQLAELKSQVLASHRTQQTKTETETEVEDELNVTTRRFASESQAI